MFVMITNMRLAVAVQGLGLAGGCADIALAYAQTRRQGGPVEAPVRIAEHPDIQRELLGLAARVEVLRGLVLALANLAELAAAEPDPEQRADAAALVLWLLPIIKTTGGEMAFEAASQAIQVLGGAGYTREWPLEQALRDARVLTIFEGSSGIQALDLMHRRLMRGDRRGLTVFKRLAREAAKGLTPEAGAPLGACLDHFETAAAALLDRADDPRGLDAGATAFLHLAALAATGWIAARLATLDSGDPARAHIVAAARFWLHDIDHRAALLHAQSVEGATPLDLFGMLRAPG
jgi:hypothetical protein